ncbi:MAG: Fe-S protein assembly chaperone HscA, partial [Betaproteobacteria bacterium]
AQVEAQRLIEATQAAMDEDPHLLSAEEKTRIDAAIEKLRLAMLGDNRRTMNLAMDDLGFETQQFAQRRMDQSIKRVLSGRKVGDLNVEEPQ